MSKISFAQTVTGQDRKTIAAVIAQALNTTSAYAGPPSFAFTAGGWSVDRQSQVISPEMDMVEITTVKEVISALHIAGLRAEGVLSMTLHGLEENTAKILSSVIKSKETLLKKALQTDVPLETVYSEGNVILSFFPATLDPEKVSAYLALAIKLAEFAGSIKYTSATEKPVENEKYALRCFLLRLGFIGPEYKAERRVLLAPLDGNAAFKNKPTDEEVSAE